MNIWTTSSFGIGYSCNLAQLVTLQENPHHEIIGAVDSSAEKCHFSNKNSSISDNTLGSKEKLLKNFLKNHFTPLVKDKTLFFEKMGSHKVSQESLLKYCYQAIERLRFLAQRDELNHSETLLCPINLTLFEDPVIDNHGHTFERSAIENHLKKSDQCPISREVIGSLLPNRSMRDLTDKMRQDPLIPLLPSMCGKKIVEDELKANRFLEMAEMLENEGDNENALDMYAKAFAYTNRIENYRTIPILLMKRNEPFKAALAYLHLAAREIQEEKLSPLVSLEKSLELVPNEKTILALKAFYLLSQGIQLEKAGKIFASLAKEEKDAIAYWKLALDCSPSDLDLYKHISNHVDEKTKVRLFLIAFSHFYDTDTVVAHQFYNMACLLEPRNPMIYFARLCRLPKNDPQKIDLYRILSEIFIEKQEHLHAITCFNKVLAKKNTAEEIQRYIDYLVRNGNARKGGRGGPPINRSSLWRRRWRGFKSNENIWSKSSFS